MKKSTRTLVILGVVAVGLYWYFAKGPGSTCYDFGLKCANSWG